MQKFSHLEFLKQILLRPIAFLDQYFTADQTCQQLKKRTSYTNLSIPISIGCLYSIVKSFEAGPKVLVLIPLFLVLGPTVLYVLYLLTGWLFAETIKWAGGRSSTAKSKDLWSYFLAHVQMVNLAGLVVKVLGNTSLEAVTGMHMRKYCNLLLVFAVFIYSLCVLYQMVKRTDQISIGNYILFFIVLDLVLVLGLMLAVILLGIFFASRYGFSPFAAY